MQGSSFVRCCGIVKKTGEQCSNPGKHVSKDGNMYCGRHIIDEVCHKLPENPDNEKAKSVLIKLVVLSQLILRKLIHVILLLAIVFVIHYHSKYYYYSHCESNLLRAWLFQNSSMCTGLRNVIQGVEGWSFDRFSMIARYVIMVGQELHIMG